MKNRAPSPRPAESGSAYIVTLLALVILTILALTLTLVTQGEIQIGGSEKTINRLFYTADGMLTLEAAAERGHISAPVTVILNRVQVGTSSSMSNTADRVTLLPSVLLTSAHADKSNSAEQSTQLYQTISRTTARSQRIAWNGNVVPDDLTPVEVLGTKTLEVEIINTMSQRNGSIDNAVKGMLGGHN